jgi:hypothetical protein
MIDRIISGVVALSLALLVWLYARSRDQEMLDSVPVPVQITLAGGQADAYSLEINGPAQVPVSFAGPPPRIRELRTLLQRNELHVGVTLTVPEDRLNEARYSDTVRIDAADVHAPPGVTAVVAEGNNRIPVTVHKMVERRLPVRFDNGTDQPTGNVLIEPATVLVRGPQEVLDRCLEIRTLPAALPSRPGGAPFTVAAAVRVPLVQQIEDRPVRVTPNKVLVHWAPPSPKVYELTEVPVHFLCPTGFPFQPRFTAEQAGWVSLQIAGPVQDEAPRPYVFIDLTRGSFTPGLRREPLQIQLPRDFHLVGSPPRRVAFELVPLSEASKRSEVPIP